MITNLDSRRLDNSLDVGRLESVLPVSILNDTREW